MVIELYFLLRGFMSYFQMKFCRIFAKFFKIRIFLSIRLSYRFKYLFFKWILIPMYALRVLRRCSEKPRLTQRHATVITCSTFESGHDIKITLIRWFHCWMTTKISPSFSLTLPSFSSLGLQRTSIKPLQIETL